MKQLINLKKVILVLSILSLFLACDPLATFNEPQPSNTSNLSKFPNRLQGKYLSLTDSSIISIDNSLILRIYDYDFQFSINEIDSNLKLSGDTLIDLNSNEKKLAIRKNDSLIIHINYKDTLFQIDNKHIVRKMKGYYFLNLQLDDNTWEVKKIQLKKGQLHIGTISTEDEIKKLDEITETPQDTISKNNTYSPTKKQFKKFIKNNGFGSNESFIKLSKNSKK